MPPSASFSSAASVHRKRFAVGPLSMTLRTSKINLSTSWSKTKQTSDPYDRARHDLHRMKVTVVISHMKLKTWTSHEKLSS